MAGIYIHIPFCKKACTYCNFHFSTSLNLKADLLNALTQEILLTKNFETDGVNIQSIYIGGGTPSLLNESEIKTMLATIRNKYQVAGNAEITLEANPDDINNASLTSWLRAGINRLSVGIQSFNEAELQWMNRAHTAAESLACLEAIKNAGFTDFSVDLIYGSPLQSDEDLVKNAQTIFAADVPHISCYALTVEPRTALNKLIETHRSAPVDSDKQASQFELLLDLMQQAGYEQYEISNFSKPGFRSKHNSSYWQGKPYYGFGPSAHSFNGTDTRRWNIANNALYIQSLKNNVVPFEEEVLTSTQRLNEYIMTSLRTAEGIDVKKVSSEFGETTANTLLQTSGKFLGQQKMLLHGNFLTLTKAGKFLADGIASDLFF